MDRNSQPIQRGRPVSGLDAAHANEYFEQFLTASSLKHILGYYRGLIDNLHLKPNVFSLFYPKLRSNLTSWKAKALWKKFDARASHKCYQKGKAASNTRVLVIGAGPCGMRAAIEAQLLGAKVVVIEKRDRFSRNNVLHLWPFVIEDLRMLGAKKFYGKFCAGAIDHISIRRLQCILLKVALLLGVEVHTEVGFEKLIEPNATEKTGWRADCKPSDHPVSQYEFDVILGADGKRNTLQGFSRKEFRGKLAIAITANFINKKTEAEARVEEISGVAFIFNQKFFKDLLEDTRIDLENIVYYKDDTHYFVMTAKKASLLEKGVIKQDLADTEKLLAPENVDREALEEYAIEAASFSTNYQMPNLEFAVNHYGQPDIAMFDFTSMFAADNASKVVERNGYRLLMILVGDSLLEPFWPTGSGCARGFLSSLDAAWAIRSWSLGTFTPLDVLAERESIYRLLAQTTPDNLNKDWKSYTLDPATRYPNLNKAVVLPHQTICLYDTDNPASIERMKRNAQERPSEVPKKRRRGNVDNEVLLSWITEQLREHDDITVTDIGSIFKDGKILCAIIHHYRPDLLDYSAIKDGDPVKNNQSAFDILEKELGIPPIMTGEEITNTEDYLTMASYLTQVYDTFRGEIPHIKQPKLKLPSKIPKSLSLSQVKSSSVSNKMRRKGDKPKKDNSKIELKLRKIERIKNKIFEKEKSDLSRENSIKNLDKKNKIKSDKTINDLSFSKHQIKRRKSVTNLGKNKEKASKDKTNLVRLKYEEESVPRKQSRGETKKRKIKTPRSKECIEGSQVNVKKRKSKVMTVFSVENKKSKVENVRDKLKTMMMERLPLIDNDAVDRFIMSNHEKKLLKVYNELSKKSTKTLKARKSKNINTTGTPSRLMMEDQGPLNNDETDSVITSCDGKTLIRIRRKRSTKSAKSQKLVHIQKSKVLNTVDTPRTLTLESLSLINHDGTDNVFKSHEDTKLYKVRKRLSAKSTEIQKLKKERTSKVTNTTDTSSTLLMPIINGDESDSFIMSDEDTKLLYKRQCSKIPKLERNFSKQDMDELDDFKRKTKKIARKPSTKFILKMKKVKLKKSKLSVIPEVKTEICDNKFKAKVIQFPHLNNECMYITSNDHLPNYNKTNFQHARRIERKYDEPELELDLFNCETIFNNNSFNRSSENSSQHMITGFCNGSPSNEFKASQIVPLPAINKLNTSPSNETSVKIRLIERKTKNKFTYQKIEFLSDLNLITISSKTCHSKTTNPKKPLNHKLFSELPPKPQDNSFKNYYNAAPNFNLKFPRYFSKNPCDSKSPNEYIFGDPWLKKLACAGDGNLNVSKIYRQNTVNKLDSCEYYKNLPNYKCHTKLNSKRKFPSEKMTMSEGDGLPDQIYSRVSNWISSHDFKVEDNGKVDAEVETVISNDVQSDITSVTRNMFKKKGGEYDGIVVEERTDVVKCRECESPVSSEDNFAEMMKNLSNNKSVRTLSKFSQYSPFQNGGNLKSASAPPTQFSVIVEGEESELPDSNKRSEVSFKTIKTSTIQPVVPSQQPSRPSSRHKRHADAMIPSKAPSIDRKTRKRRTLEKVGASVEERQKMLEEIASNRSERQNKRKQQRKLQTEQFLKSMQMLQANSLDSEPFEDYSIFLYRQTAPKFEDRVKDLEKQFTYVPDHESKVANAARGGGTDEDLAARIKSLENKWRDPQPVDKKPKDLLRAIGKIETSDWNIKEIEKKIMENKLGKPSKAYDKEKVPKWSKEQFVARQTKMEKQHLDRQDSAEAKFADIDRSIKHLDQKLKEGTVRELGQNKVATITEKLVSKAPPEPKPVEKTTTRQPVLLPAQGGSEFCHFCSKRVYLMERLSAEGRFFHHGCFKCQYCNTQLRLGSYAFDRDGQYGHKFFCIHHYGMVGEINPPVKVTRKPLQKAPREAGRSPEKKQLSGVAGVDLLDRVQTPERIEFSNLSTGNISSDQEESLSQMDEDEWTDKNFGASCAEGDSEDDSSSLSDTDSDDEDAFDDALEEPVTKEGTMKWAERWKNSYSRKRRDSDSNGYSSSDQSSYYENSSDDDESDTATEGEEEIRARELRKQEVRVEPPVVQTDTGTDTEVVSDETSSESSSEIQNSATEISTDSEFAHDDPTPTREIPAIVLNDFNVTKTRGSGGNNPKRIQVTTGYLQRPSNGKQKKPNIELKLKPLVPSAPSIKKPAPVLLPHTEGYALNRTQSTGGIAAKVSLELKKKYLLGEAAPGTIQKSGSASTLDSKFKTFHTNISDCQKLLKPAPEISASMQTFCKKLNERHSPILSPQSSVIFDKKVEVANLDKQTEEKELPPPDVTNVTPIISDDKEVPEPEPYVFQNESEGRPRSPVHETSIIVPQIDWSKQNQCQSSDSLCTSSSDNEIVTTPNFQFENIPRVEVHTANDCEHRDDIPPDSLGFEEEKPESPADNSSVPGEPIKSITSEKKILNQPKSLPNLENMLPEIHNSLHVNLGRVEKKIMPEVDTKSSKNSSGLSSPDSGGEQATAALTETELSDWARDGAVSDDFEDVDFEFTRDSDKPYKKPTEPSSPAKTAKMPEFDDIGHICGKDKQAKDLKNKTIITETMNSILSANLDNIEFMDTGTETSSDDGVAYSQDGYVLFKNEDDFAEDSLNPTINEILEARNVHVNDKYETRNTGYCILANEDKRFVSNVIDLKPSDLEKLKQKQTLADPEEDSLLIVETGTTTEENTCSDSTVKNITEITADKNQTVGETLENEILQKQRLEEKLTKVKAEAEQKKFDMRESSHKENIVDSNKEFEEHCQRLQSKVEFGNVKDSIDVRKSRRKSKSESPQKPDLIQEEKSSPLHTTKDITLSLTPASRTPDILYKKEILKKERDVNQKLIQEMVMNKMKAENKSLERKKRGKPVPTGLSPKYDLSKSATTDVSQINLDNSNRSSTYSTGSSTYATPDVLLSTNMVPLQNSQSINTVPDLNSSTDVYSTPLSRPMSVYSAITERKLEDIKTSQPLTNSENISLPDIRKSLFSEDFVTPKAPPRQHRLNDGKNTEKLKQDARARARLLSNEELGLSPEEKLSKLREKVSRRGKENEIADPHLQESIESLVMNTERRNSWLYSNDTLSKKKNNSFRRSKSGDCATRASNPKLSTYSNNMDVTAPIRTNSVSEFPNNYPMVRPQNAKSETKKICKSDPNLLETDYVKPKKKSKDRERRKSITKLISTLFTKKSPTGSSSKGLFSKFSPKSKDISKSCANLDLREAEVVIEEPIRRKSLTEVSVQRTVITPPPIPPLPLNYTVKGTDDSSEGEPELKKQDRSSCDTLDQSGILENSSSSLTGRRTSKSARKVARQAQLKRHRMAQEIQRKLEETEVKTRELETRGVLVEKFLRGEDSADCSKDESELLQEWFDLMRDRTELRRYEKELMVRAQELELEDRHARLQHELRDRLENNEPKTEEDVKVEESIINEMMEIVSKRDSLIAVIEEDRLRYSHEDRDLEEQMLAKGLRLTPIRKSSET